LASGLQLLDAWTKDTRSDIVAIRQIQVFGC